MQMMAERQGSNPEFSFLAGGLGHEYYAWALYCGLKGLNVSKPPPPSPAAAPPAAAPPAAAVAPPPRAAPPPQDTSAVLQGLPAEVSSGWQTVLGMLSGSRDSIQNSQAWFMACAPYAAGMAELMLQVRRAEELSRSVTSYYCAHPAFRLSPSPVVPTHMHT